MSVFRAGSIWRKLNALLAQRRRRRHADQLLRISEGRWENHPAIAWRVAELTTEQERRDLARSLGAVVSIIHRPYKSAGSSPLNRRALAPHVAELERLAERLSDLDQPVTAAGIVLTRDLLTGGESPLYLGGDVTKLPAMITVIYQLLDVD